MHLQEVNTKHLLMQVHKDQLAQLNKDLNAMNIAVTSFKPVNSLEKYFLSLTGTNQHVAAFTN